MPLLWIYAWAPDGVGEGRTSHLRSLRNRACGEVVQTDALAFYACKTFPQTEEVCVRMDP